ncbi:HAMP domain-containing sensor histidine kinase [Eleftheria terrae]|uniref:HAMP domain-containing sensor histidine kinase n=1 Tax=Eleftheria terrae TaxID=1597781 RepID=UPI00263BE7AA|nr:HAMP domain-containing sensor histidine kinase [Eleftheria terrae]WKB53115.1 HAMP domain-containing histidine kinase [Eleftheria terrae]
MKRWLRLRPRLPFGLRVFFRGAFALLACATLALAVNVLQDEKQRSHRNYQDGLLKNQAQIAARLRHPTGQLALLNPGIAAHAVTPLRPLVLPFSAIDFDDKAKAQQAVEMAGCHVQYPDSASLCVAVGNNPYAGGFLYLVGSFISGELAPHAVGELDFSTSHRVAIEVAMRGRTFRWIAPFEALDDGNAPGVRGRLTGYSADAPIVHGTRSVRDFRGWLWQDGRCLEAGDTAADCRRRSFFSVRLPVDLFRDALFQKRPVWPPPDLDQIVTRLQVLAPGDGSPLFDSNADGAARPFSLADLRPLLLPGETLSVRRLGSPAGTPAPELFRLTGAADAADPASPWMDRLIRRLPVEGYEAPIVSREVIATPLGRYELTLTGDVRTVNRNLAAVATRVSWFVGAMLLAVLLTWLAIEVRIIRRITLLTRRAASVSTGVRGADGLARIDLSDLRGGDELGVLAQGLQDLLQRVNEDVKREQIRAEQEKDMWQAVGHEIMSPLQSLMALHGTPDDPSHRYISRMQQAVRVLYGHASPSEAFDATTLALQALDVNEFLAHVAGNAPYTGIESVVFDALPQPVQVRADEYSLEDVVTHVLRNGDRYRPPGTPIQMRLEVGDSEARVLIHNQGPPVPADMLEKIFEYGVSDAQDAAALGQRGQGLFVARTYMAKMGGRITARNQPDGVVFELVLQRSSAVTARP